jgi:hypothetical protein
MCHPNCVTPCGVHMSPKMCDPSYGVHATPNMCEPPHGVHVSPKLCDPPMATATVFGLPNPRAPAQAQGPGLGLALQSFAVSRGQNQGPMARPRAQGWPLALGQNPMHRAWALALCRALGHGP